MFRSPQLGQWDPAPLVPSLPGTGRSSPLRSLMPNPGANISSKVSGSCQWRKELRHQGLGSRRAQCSPGGLGAAGQFHPETAKWMRAGQGPWAPWRAWATPASSCPRLQPLLLLFPRRDLQVAQMQGQAPKQAICQHAHQARVRSSGRRPGIEGGPVCTWARMSTGTPGSRSAQRARTCVHVGVSVRASSAAASTPCRELEVCGEVPCRLSVTCAPVCACFRVHVAPSNS